jgi:hypothetical protein
MAPTSRAPTKPPNEPGEPSLGLRPRADALVSRPFSSFLFSEFD